MSKKINNIHLNYAQFSEKILIDSIENLSVHTILITQENLSKDFINNYILNKEYHIFREDSDITKESLYLYQPEYFK